MRHSFHPPTEHATVFPTSARQSVAITKAGLVLGDGSVLIRMSKGDGAPRLSLDADHHRFAVLMSIVGDRPLAAKAFRHIEAADRFWQRGDKALANLRLIFADLPRLATLCDVHRLTLAAHLLDEGLAPDALAKELGLELATGVLKYAPGQAHVPAGHGGQSGEFTFGREPAAAPAAQIVLAEEDEGPANDPEATQHFGESIQTPSKDPKTYFRRPSIFGSAPPVPVVPPVGGGGESDGAPAKQPEQPHSPFQPGSPSPNLQPLPPGIGVGPYATKSIPAGPSPSPRANTSQQKELNKIGVCHNCGTTEPGTESGNFVGDHQPATALVPEGTEQDFFCHCLRCARVQGGLVRQYLRRQKEKQKGEK